MDNLTRLRVTLTCKKKFGLIFAFDRVRAKKHVLKNAQRFSGELELKKK